MGGWGGGANLCQRALSCSIVMLIVGPPRVTINFGTPCIYYMLRTRLYLGLDILVCLYRSIESPLFSIRTLLAQCVLHDF